MLKVNPRQIVLAREARKLTQGGLCELTPSLTQSNLSKIEQGQLRVSEQVLDEISKALNYPPSFFHEAESRPALSNLYYRKLYQVNGKTLKHVNAMISIYTNAISKLLEEIEMPYPLIDYNFDIKDGWTPKKAAIAVRELLGIPKGPIRDLISYVEKAGIIVFLTDFETTGFDGAAAFSEAGNPIIFVDKTKSNDRIRMNIAHELAHIIMHIPYLVEPFRDVEQEAKEFAGEFLAPSSDIKSDLTNLSYPKLLEVKQYWQISKAAVVSRAFSLKMISPTTYKYLNIELGRRGERKKETGFVYIDKPTLLDQIINLYRTQKSETISSLAEKVILSESDFMKYFISQGDVPKLRIV